MVRVPGPVSTKYLSIPTNAGFRGFENGLGWRFVPSAPRPVQARPDRLSREETVSPRGPQTQRVSVRAWCRRASGGTIEKVARRPLAVSHGGKTGNAGRGRSRVCVLN